MPFDERTGVGMYEGDEGDGGMWEKMFTTAVRAYYKDFRMREMDNTFGDLYALICGMLNPLGV